MKWYQSFEGSILISIFCLTTNYFNTSNEVHQNSLGFWYNRVSVFILECHTTGFRITPWEKNSIMTQFIIRMILKNEPELPQGQLQNKSSPSPNSTPLTCQQELWKWVRSWFDTWKFDSIAGGNVSWSN